jgi:hypothetical protein
MKLYFKCFLGLFTLCISLPLIILAKNGESGLQQMIAAESSSANSNLSKQSGDYLNCQAPENRPHNSWSNWARRTEVFFRTNESPILPTKSQWTPEWALRTIQPLYQEKNYRNTYFVQAQGAELHHTQYYNIGVGYRYLTRREQWLLGANFFYDVAHRHVDQRIGIGLEAFYRNVSFRANYYQPITGSTKISSQCSFRKTEAALAGVDAEAEVPVPFFPWVRFYLSGYYWKESQYKAIKGGRGGFRFNLTSFLTMEAGRSVNNQEDRNGNYLQVSLSFGNPPEIEYNMLKNTYTKNAFPNRCLPRHTLEKVRRQDPILTETRKEDRSCAAARSGGGGRGPNPPVCRTCASVECGIINDGCGHVINCGLANCPAGRPNCVNNICVP